MRNAIPLGARLLRGASSVGQRLSDGGNKMLNSLESVPIIGGALKATPGYSTARAGLNILGTASSIGNQGANALERLHAGDTEGAMKVGSHALERAKRLGSGIEKTVREGRGSMYAE